MKTKSKQLSNVELVLLQLIFENEELSGYNIKSLIEERGYREWADIGETSIYSGLDKLNKKKLVEFYVHIDKQGKGPSPKKFKLTGEGRNAFKDETLEALSSTRERDRRFDIALAAVSLIDVKEILQALKKRKLFLSKEKERIAELFYKQNGLTHPKHVQLLFKHPSVLIEAELGFIDDIINALTDKETYSDYL